VGCFFSLSLSKGVGIATTRLERGRVVKAARGRVVKRIAHTPFTNFKVSKIAFAVIEGIIALPVGLAVGIPGTSVKIGASILADTPVTNFPETEIAFAVSEGIIAVPVGLAEGILGTLEIIATGIVAGVIIRYTLSALFIVTSVASAVIEGIIAVPPRIWAGIRRAAIDEIKTIIPMAPHGVNWITSTKTSRFRSTAVLGLR